MTSQIGGGKKEQSVSWGFELADDLGRGNRDCRARLCRKCLAPMLANHCAYRHTAEHSRVARLAQASLHLEADYVINIQQRKSQNNTTIRPARTEEFAHAFKQSCGAFRAALFQVQAHRGGGAPSTRSGARNKRHKAAAIFRVVRVHEKAFGVSGPRGSPLPRICLKAAIASRWARLGCALPQACL